jgi:hypothetical protein
MYKKMSAPACKASIANTQAARGRYKGVLDAEKSARKLNSNVVGNFGVSVNSFPAHFISC